MNKFNNIIEIIFVILGTFTLINISYGFLTMKDTIFNILGAIIIFIVIVAYILYFINKIKKNK